MILRIDAHPPRKNPAYAGNTFPKLTNAAQNRDQPHLREECRGYPTLSGVLGGINPACAGKGCCTYSRRKDRRSNPACARKSTSAGAPRWIVWNNPAYAGNMALPVGMDFINVGQPRMHGEYYTHRDTGDYPAGSTPRIRGVHLPTSKLTSQIPVPGTTLIIH